MAKKISQLTQATEVKSDDVTVIVQDGETKKLPLNMMVTKQDIENKKVAGLAKLDEIEATYENDTYTPTITVKNKSSVKVGEGDEVDYSANVMDGPAKSAILSGQTLVNIFQDMDYVWNNLIKQDNFNYNNGDLIILNNGNPDGRYWNTIPKIPNIKSNTEYTMIFTKGNSPYVEFGTVDENGSSIMLNRYKNARKIKITSPNNGDLRVKFCTSNPSSEESPINLGKVMLIEGDYTNIDVPYFEGMQSVKMPVLTTTGKNLFTGKYSDFSDGGYGSFKYGEIGKNYTISLYDNDTNISLDGISLGISVKGNEGNTLNWMTNGNEIYISQLTKNTLDAFTIRPNNEESLRKIMQRFNIQIEEGTQATSYEPYKSNILSCNEEVTLRGIGEVQDTLDCLTGKVTQRIGEVVLDDTLSYEHAWNGDRDTETDYVIGAKVVNPSWNVYDEQGSLLFKCDKLRTRGITSFENLNVGYFLFYVSKSDLGEELTNAKIREYMISLNATVQYPLATPVIKTVDLMPSGTHPSTTPYCWKNGHIQLSSSGLLPNLEYSVVTSRAGQINQNATMIVKNDKRIFDLEILLAGGLVNTTYQALTLQNQVETGLSKVSLSSETEPDYLLYHMIMKLIEEKAYKLDDLTEKVSVFYLYEKLSDEQFETIYSALYPFVEDEIVEEPVVEELPEVVEDEVIM